MGLFITKKKLIEQMAKELTYLHIQADWWYYVSELDDVGERRSMYNEMLSYVQELCRICYTFGILEEVYEEAYKIYDFRDSCDIPYANPNIELIEKLNREFCDPMKTDRPVL